MNRGMNVVSVHDPGGQLRIGRRPPHIDHEIPRHGHSNLGTQLPADDVERQIDPGSDPRAGRDVTILDEDAIAVHGRARLELLQPVDHIVMRRTFTATQQPGMRGQQAPRTNTHQRNRLIATNDLQPLRQMPGRLRLQIECGAGNAGDHDDRMIRHFGRQALQLVKLQAHGGSQGRTGGNELQIVAVWNELAGEPKSFGGARHVQQHDLGQQREQHRPHFASPH